jgi:hypothetical protein
MKSKTRLLPVLLVVLYMGTARASSATFQVTVTNDAGAGSLRQAILAANASAGPDIIAFNIVPLGLSISIFPASALPIVCGRAAH